MIGVQETFEAHNTIVVLPESTGNGTKTVPGRVATGQMVLGRPRPNIVSPLKKKCCWCHDPLPIMYPGWGYQWHMKCTPPPPP